MTKAGQKCTAVRRIIVPEKLVEDVQIALGQRLSNYNGDPQIEGEMISAGNEQKKNNRKSKSTFKTQEIVFGSLRNWSNWCWQKQGALSPILFK